MILNFGFELDKTNSYKEICVSKKIEGMGVYHDNVKLCIFLVLENGIDF